MSTVREKLSQDEILVRDKGADKLEIANIVLSIGAVLL